MEVTFDLSIWIIASTGKRPTLFQKHGKSSKCMYLFLMNRFCRFSCISVIRFMAATILQNIVILIVCHQVASSLLILVDLLQVMYIKLVEIKS